MNEIIERLRLAGRPLDIDLARLSPVLHADVDGTPKPDSRRAQHAALRWQHLPKLRA